MVKILFFTSFVSGTKGNKIIIMGLVWNIVGGIG